MNSIELNRPTTKVNFLAKPNNDKNLLWIFIGYLYLLFFIGRFPAFQQAVIWVVGPVFVIFVMVSYLQKPFKLPNELSVYAIFMVWTLSGYLIAIDLNPFFRYLRLIFTILILIACSEIVLMKTGSIQSVFKLYVLIGLSYFIYDILTGEFSSGVQEEGWRYGGLISDSNWNAFMAFTALTGVCFSWRNSKKLMHRIIMYTLLTIFISSTILSASRGGFITTLVFLIFWLIFSNMGLFKKHKLVFVLTILVLFPIIVFAYDFVMANTFLGERFAYTINSETEVTDEKRIQLYIYAFQIFTENPIWGIGLSQFLVLTDYTAFTHSDYMELLSTTGFVGFSIMMTFYIIVIMKVIKLKRKITSEILIYRLNLFLAIIIAILVFGFFYTNFISIMSMLQFSVIAGYVNYLENKLKDYNSYIEYRRMKEKHTLYLKNV